MGFLSRLFGKDNPASDDPVFTFPQPPLKLSDSERLNLVRSFVGNAINGDPLLIVYRSFSFMLLHETGQRVPSKKFSPSTLPASFDFDYVDIVDFFLEIEDLCGVKLNGLPKVDPAEIEAISLGKIATALGKALKAR